MKLSRALPLLALLFAVAFAVMAATQTAEAQQDDAPPLALNIVEIRNAHFSNEPLTNVWGDRVGLWPRSDQIQWEVVPERAGTVALRNVSTGRYLAALGNRGVVASGNHQFLGARFLWRLETNGQGQTLLRNARTGRYLDADSTPNAWFSVDQSRRPTLGTGWLLVPVGNPPLPTPTATVTVTPTPTLIPTPQPTATVGPTPQPTATVGPTPQPTATVGPTPQPTATVAQPHNQPPPSARRHHHPSPLSANRDGRPDTTRRPVGKHAYRNQRSVIITRHGARTLDPRRM